MADNQNTLRLNLLASLVEETFQPSEVARSLEDIAMDSYGRISRTADAWLGVPTNLLQAAATYRCAIALEQIGHQLQLLLEQRS